MILLTIFIVPSFWQQAPEAVVRREDPLWSRHLLLRVAYGLAFKYLYP
jgi:hypothetical protein